MSANILFISPALIKSRTGISDAIDDKQIKPQIKVAQDIYIQPALGSTLYIRLQEGIDANNLTAAETTLLNSYVTDALIWFTVAQLPMALGYQFFSKGVLQKTAEESNTPSRPDLELLSNHYKQNAEWYKQRLIQYLRENYTLYLEYMQTGSGLDVIFPETRAYTSPMWLGTNSAIPEIRSYNNNSYGGTLSTVEFTPIAGVASFNVSQLAGRTVLIATRSGAVKGVTTLPTTNSLYLQINSLTVTLPTGDVTQAGELFTFTYK
jgi:hypothetical protein